MAQQWYEEAREVKRAETARVDEREPDSRANGHGSSARGDGNRIGAGDAQDDPR